MIITRRCLAGLMLVGLLHVTALGAHAQAQPAAAEGVLAVLDRTIAALSEQNTAAARDTLAGFEEPWLQVETDIKARSPETYSSTENRIAAATAQLNATPPGTLEALASLRAARQELAPLMAEPAQYGVTDAAIILLREGLEALLVMAALLAFLTRAGHADKQAWLWVGAAAGVVLSFAVALAIQRLFATAMGGASRELVEGVSGLIAAAMLVYVSYWLHARSSLHAWQTYVREKTSAALAGGGMLSLALVSFLSVFREGAETSLFYIGIASSIATRDLALGIALGAAGLVIIGGAVVVFGVRIPLRPFFFISSLLLYYLAFKFVGTGVHALQAAGVLPTTPAALPAWDTIGVFPTWETTLPQLALVALGVLVVVLSRRLVRPATKP